MLHQNKYILLYNIKYIVQIYYKKARLLPGLHEFPS